MLVERRQFSMHLGSLGTLQWALPSWLISSAVLDMKVPLLGGDLDITKNRRCCLSVLPTNFNCTHTTHTLHMNTLYIHTQYIRRLVVTDLLFPSYSIPWGGASHSAMMVLCPWANLIRAWGVCVPVMLVLFQAYQCFPKLRKPIQSMVTVLVRDAHLWLAPSNWVGWICPVFALCSPQGGQAVVLTVMLVAFFCGVDSSFPRSGRYSGLLGGGWGILR